MPHFVLQYAEKPAKPPPRRWTAWRVFVWTLLAASLTFWASALLGH